MKKNYSRLVITLAFCLGLFTTSGVSAQEDPEKPLPHFLFPSFREGVIRMKDGSAFKTMLNYNLLEQRLVTEFNGTYRYSKNPALIDTVYIEDKAFVPVDGIFYEILSTGIHTFYVQNRAMFVPAGQDVGYGVKSQSSGPTRYSRFEIDKLQTDVAYYGEVVYLDLPPNGEIKPASVYWVSQGSELKKFINVKQLIKILPQYKLQVQQYIDKKKVNFKSPGEVALLCDYLNTGTAGK